MQIYDQQLSTVEAMRKLFEGYCASRNKVLDFSLKTVDNICTYSSYETGIMFEWFIRGIIYGCED